MRPLALAWALVGLLWLAALGWPVQAAPAQEVRFSQEPCDRPVLTTRQQVWDARTAGGYPREYVDYAAWWVRLD